MKIKLSYKNKINILILSYSAVITLVVLILGFSLLNRVEKRQIDEAQNYFITYSTQEINKGITSGINIKPSDITDRVISVNEFKVAHSNDILKQAITVMSGVFLFVMAISFIISKIISKKIIRPIEEIAANLPQIINNENIEIDDKNILSGELKGFKVALDESTKKIKNLLKEANNINSYITHEQKNSLAVLRSKIQMGEREDLFKIIDKMSSSLDDILAINATEDVKYFEAVDLTLICAEAVDIYKKEYKNIYLDIDEENIVQIKGRSLWIYRAVCNLIENAIKYSDGSDILVKAYNKNGSSIISVQDYGTGIKKEILDNIFNHKYRGENLKKDGYGIGLSLVNHITSLCDGITFVESEEGKGTKFYMAFNELTLD
jgi:signal transduction histidine kinase